MTDFIELSCDGGAVPSSFNDLFPKDTDFFGSVQGRNVCLVRGKKGRFSNVFQLNALETVLSTHRLPFRRLRLVRDGVTQPEGDYTKAFGDYRSLDAKRFHELLREGYALVVDEFDQCLPSVRNLADWFETSMREAAQVNLYCGLSGSSGFAPHWDGHEVFVVQVAGSKRWTVLKGGRVHPLDRDVVHQTNAPAEVLWEGEVNEGDVLYIPRGVWHSAKSSNDLSVHLTVGVSCASSADYLHWIIDRLCREEIVRKDLLHTAKGSDREDSISQLASLVQSELNPESVEEYLNFRSTVSVSKANISLQHAVRRDPIGDDQRLTPTSPLFRVLINDDGATVEMDGLSRTLASSVGDALEQIFNKGGARYSEIQSLVGSKERAQELCFYLLSEGLVRTDEP